MKKPDRRVAVMGRDLMVVISHEATRTGSVRVLLDLLDYCRVSSDMDMVVESLVDGPLGDELRSRTTRPRPVDEASVIIANSAMSAGRLLAHRPGIPSVAYIHEEADALAVLPDDARTALPHFTRVLCVSERSRASLVGLGVDPQRLTVLPPVVAPPSDRVPEATDGPTGLGSRSGDVLPALRDLHERSHPIVVGCGEASWRKGTDLFVDVCRKVNDVIPVDFAWIGRRARGFGRVLDNDVRLLGMSDRLLWVGEVDDPGPYFDTADILTMTSREDPQPLTPFEAAHHGTPTIGFAVGGLTEMADAGMAVTVLYPDTSAMANAVVKMLNDPKLRTDLARRASADAVANRSVAELGNKFLAVVAAAIEEAS